MSPRVCLIGFDSPDQDILAQLLADGGLPNFERVLRDGACVELRQHQELAASSAWVSIMTGATVAEHGSADSERFVPDGYRIEPAGLPPTKSRPFWASLGPAGLRSTVVSMYGAELVPGLPGKQVVGWGSHDPYARDRWVSEPPGLVRELERDFGPRRLRYAVLPPRDDDAARAYLAQMLEGTEQQARALATLAAGDDWDFFAGSFGDCHQAGHHLWHYSSPKHPRHDPAAPAELREGLASIYAKVDEGIGRIAAVLPDDAVLLLVSPYGLTTNHRLFEAVGPLLSARGWLHRRAGGAITDPRLRALSVARRTARRLLPHRARWELSKRLPRDRVVGALALADVDWDRTKAFPIPADVNGAVRLNLAGREPAGVVEPHAYDAACEELAGEILALRDDAGPVAAEVRRFDELWGVEPWDGLPDLTVRWRQGPVHGELRAAHGELVELPGRDGRVSIHSEPGFLAGVGPGIAASGAARLAGPSVGLTDVGPTVLHLLGVEKPQELSGSAIPSLAAPGSGDAAAQAAPTRARP